MKNKIEAASKVAGVSLDEETHQDLVDLTKSPELNAFIASLPEDYFQQLFWKQQCEAASKKNHHSMRWHPMMIRWCLDLRRR